MLVRLDGESKKLDQSFVHSGTNPSLNRSKDQVFKARFSIIRNIANYEIDVTLIVTFIYTKETVELLEIEKANTILTKPK